MERDRIDAAAERLPEAVSPGIRAVATASAKFRPPSLGDE